MQRIRDIFVLIAVLAFTLMILFFVTGSSGEGFHTLEGGIANGCVVALVTWYAKRSGVVLKWRWLPVVLPILLVVVGHLLFSIK